MMQAYPGIDPDISKWKGQEITDFQEDLRIKVNGQISEKWFYTHIKAESSSLPRIDVLDLLSQYAGYINWQDFRYKNMVNLPREKKQGRPVIRLIRIPLVFISVMTLLLVIMKLINTQNYSFDFIDADTGEPITDNNLRAELLMENESPVSLLSDENGSIIVRTNQSRVKMVVKAPYYLTDTVTRIIRKFNHYEQINLHADYYALMIGYFSKSNVESWTKRREQLAGIFRDDAIIYQFPEKYTGNGMALYNKWEFIDKITMPTSDLRQIEILDCRYINSKIAIMRFRIKADIE